MSWEETVRLCPGLIATVTCHMFCHKAQAKTTWDIAFKAGRVSIIEEIKAGNILVSDLLLAIKKEAKREVAEDIIRYLDISSDDEGCYVRICNHVSFVDWQAYLKKEGLDGD